MKSLSWYKRYPEDFLSGTAKLSLEEKGAYSVVLDLIYLNGGAVADDARWIASQCGCSTRRWNAIRGRLIANDKLVQAGNKLTNLRAETELYRTATSRVNRQINGKIGGDKTAENRLLISQINDLQKQLLEYGSSHARAYSRKEDSSLPSKVVPLPPEEATEQKVNGSSPEPFQVSSVLLNSALTKARH